MELISDLWQSLREPLVRVSVSLYVIIICPVFVVLGTYVRNYYLFALLFPSAMLVALNPFGFSVYSALSACNIQRRRTRRGCRVGGARRFSSIYGLALALSTLALYQTTRNYKRASYIIDLGIDFLGMTETWLNSENGDGIIKSVCPDGYSALLLPRPNRRGVGLELIHKTSIEVRRPARPPPLIQPTSFECIDLSLVFRTRRVRFLLVYRLPSSSTACFDEFSSILEVISVTSDRLHIVGDFNFHGESESNSAEYPSLQFNHKVEGKLYIFK